MAKKPVVLILHGAWHIPQHYDKLVDTLTNKGGYTVRIPRLPTCQNALPMTATLGDDCATALSTANSLADQGHYIIALLHSWGGVIATNSLAKASAAHRARHGLPGGVVRLIYMCAFLLPHNASLFSAAFGVVPPYILHDDETDCASMQDPGFRFYAADVADADERERLVAMLTLHPWSAQIERGRAAVAAYRVIPTSYLVCEKDNALPAEAQWGMIKAAEGEVVVHGEGEDAMETGGVFGGKVDAVVLPQAGHSPFLSCPVDILKCIDRLAAVWEESRK